MSGRDKFFCDSCHSKQEAEKQVLIKKLPPVLVLHLKRFKFIEQLGRYKKLGYRISFPFELRIDITTNTCPNGDRLYELFAIVIHIGSSPNFGHYTTIIKSHGHWLLFDDDTIDLISENQIKEMTFGATTEVLNQPHKTDCGYLLFYQQVQS